MRTRRSFLGLAAASIAAGRIGRASAADREPYTAAKPAMGCLWTVRLYGGGADAEETKPAEAADAVFARLTELDGMMSDYQPDSELMKLCATAGTGKAVAVSDALFRVLEQSIAAAEQSGGLFDVTLGPCTRLWRKSRKERRLPDSEELAAARAAVGWRGVVLNASSRTVELKKAGMQLDLGGIAKGFALDECLRLLRDKHGIDAALIDAAGEVAVGSPPPGREKWTIALKPMDPQAPGDAVLLDVRDAAVDTSGDLHQFVEIGGVRYSHIVDPRTGMGMTGRAQVTAVAGSASLADWLATALCLMEEAPGRALAAKFPGVHVRAAGISGSGELKEWQTEGFAGLVHRPDAAR